MATTDAVRAVADRGPAPRRRVDGARVVGRRAAGAGRACTCCASRTSIRRASSPGREARIEEDLRWLGLDWDEGPPRQSATRAAYEQAIAKLAATGSVYPCDCSRAEIARAASAPHAGEETVYPGTCRDARPGARDEAAAGAARARAGRGDRLRGRRGRARRAEPRARGGGLRPAAGRRRLRVPARGRRRRRGAWGSPTSCAGRTSCRRRRGRSGSRACSGSSRAAVHARRAGRRVRTGRASRSGRAGRPCASCARRACSAERGPRRARVRARPGVANAPATAAAMRSRRVVGPGAGLSPWRTRAVADLGGHSCAGEGVARGSPRTQRKPSAGTW